MHMIQLLGLWHTQPWYKIFISELEKGEDKLMNHTRNVLYVMINLDVAFIHPISYSLNILLNDGCATKISGQEKGWMKVMWG